MNGVVHSLLGASSAERWIACPGSVALIQALGPIDEGEEPAYRDPGRAAHAIAAHCLLSGADGWETMSEGVAAETAEAVQSYLDYVRALPGERLVEMRVSYADFSPQMFGTLDCAVLNPEGEIALEVVDYKHGVGVTVEIDDNLQLRYYALALIDGDAWPAGSPRLGDNARVRLTIAQPRVTWHPDGGIRSADTTAGELREWGAGVLRPAMARAGEETFHLGEHCRFCPARLVCPSMRRLATDAGLAAHETAHLPDMDGDWLAAWYARADKLKMFIRAIEDETLRRLMRGEPVGDIKLVHARSDRAWKPEAPIEARFGAAAFDTVLKSPAKIEKLAGGKAFVAEFAHQPEGRLTVALGSDRRPAVVPLTDIEAFAAVSP